METLIAPSSNAQSPLPPRVTPVHLRAPPRLSAPRPPLEELLEIHHVERLLNTPAHPSVHQPAPSLTAAPAAAAAPAPLRLLPPRSAARFSKALSRLPTRATSPQVSSPPRWCHSVMSPRPAPPHKAWPSPSPTVLLTALLCPTVLLSPGPWLLCSYCTNRWAQEEAILHHLHILGWWRVRRCVQHQHFHCRGDLWVKWGLVAFKVRCLFCLFLVCLHPDTSPFNGSLSFAPRLQPSQDASFIWTYTCGSNVRSLTWDIRGQWYRRCLLTAVLAWWQHRPADFWAQRRVALWSKWKNWTVCFTNHTHTLV